MKRLTPYLLALTLLLPLALQSCKDDETGPAPTKQFVNMATVKAESGRAYYLVRDDGKTLRPEATEHPFYEAIDGQRVIADFELLSGQANGYDSFVKINKIYNVPTKPIIELTEENEKDISDDVIDKVELWVGGKYLNVDLTVRAAGSSKHHLNLVKNTLIKDLNDGYAYLELRHGQNGDGTKYTSRGLISFDLGGVGPSLGALKGLKVKVRLQDGGVKVFLINYKDLAGNSKNLNQIANYEFEAFE